MEYELAIDGSIYNAWKNFEYNYRHETLDIEAYYKRIISMIIYMFRLV